MPNPVNFMSKQISYGPITVSGECYNCKKVVAVLMAWGAFLDWRRGKFIQDVAPELTLDEREFLMTRICGKCFDERFKAEG